MSVLDFTLKDIFNRVERAKTPDPPGIRKETPPLPKPAEGFWIPEGLTPTEQEAFVERVCILMDSEFTQEEAEREAWLQYYCRHPEKFTDQIIFQLGAEIQRTSEPLVQLTLKDYKEREDRYE